MHISARLIGVMVGSGTSTYELPRQIESVTSRPAHLTDLRGHSCFSHSRSPEAMPY